MHRIWKAILVRVLGKPEPEPGRDDGSAPPGGADDVEDRGDRFAPYIRARVSADACGTVYHVTLEGVDRRFRRKADAVSYCRGRMVRLGLRP